MLRAARKSLNLGLRTLITTIRDRQHAPSALPAVGRGGSRDRAGGGLKMNRAILVRGACAVFLATVGCSQQGPTIVSGTGGTQGAGGTGLGTGGSSSTGG